MFSVSVAGGGAFTEEATQTPGLARQHLSVARATRIGSGTQSGSRTRIRRIATAHHKNKRKRHRRKDGRSFCAVIDFGTKGCIPWSDYFKMTVKNGQADVSELTKTHMQHQVVLRLIN